MYCDPWSCRTARPRAIALPNPPKRCRTPLADRLQGLEAGSLRMRVDPDTFGGAMIDRDEHRRLALAGDCRRQIGAPHRVDRVGDDGAVVVARTARRANPGRRQQVVLSHQPEHPSHRRAGPGITQSRPDFAMPLTMERTGGEYILDGRG